ncbi:MAG: hypothetical protein A2487_13445 [Candidatus Raymondbacteria bacterium RifOxyC12_full_50_8]|uniref:Resolvase HTH domain-containing protein n=1 Tax=Candidatus Raymondbacteria bacterium RIFOXYD12_FULL_49_13 TaxID=1817890 RepID=A0A1F7F7S4_UNCRA|nr:MAG: hypothetical protein A2248_13555 [Candidatus Raymondbacteria bacterium RIFOXYA2_FULL_49_16]OGJ95151.1 MAG: hypothetical protein A2350_09410 [Candidatus Raymondbacteria bacterium RifOxyB12_full_50_8]OGK00363.1 MAG: hypothetical protein A2487_13445 [Candidatus Raymondbacteria bacterium RifOxyC12_full_50_8]OGK02720.1 MAG: hypothetical protein A2519_09665 [Candidatus Raymondbacteria bacterium RIFOXYD12_FULL_49_13]OGP42366.1 MAG: hypothetical protein A2324_20335 [Candidatus Raymondbacteria b
MARVTKDQLIQLQKTLKTDAAIGKKFGITRQAIHQLRVKYGIDYNRKKNKERDEQVSAMFKSGKTGFAISKKIDLSVSQIYRIIRKMSKKRK